MFSKEMEALIQATLEDGILEENEKAALIKRAQKEGIDLDELEIYINSILQKRKRELAKEEDAKQTIVDQKKKEAIGSVCPKCGKQVPPLTLKCDCGYEFTTSKSASSVQLFFEKINNIQLTDAEIDSCSDVIEEHSEGRRHNEYRVAKDANGNVVKKVDERKIKELKEKKKIEIISSFPVPNTKEDIVEFLSLSASNCKRKGGLWGTIIGRILILSLLIILIFVLCILFGGIEPKGYDEPSGVVIGGAISFFIALFGGIVISVIDKDTIDYNKRAVVWRAKFDQVLMKGRSMRGDEEFLHQLDYYEGIVNQK